MIGGQVVDILSEGKKLLEVLEYIHRHKTAALIEAAVVMGQCSGAVRQDRYRLWKATDMPLGGHFRLQTIYLMLKGMPRFWAKRLGGCPTRQSDLSRYTGP